jgi:aconitase B
MDLEQLINRRNTIWKDYMKHFDSKKNEFTIPYPYDLNDTEKEIYEILKSKSDDEAFINDIILKNCWIKRKKIYI